ncbi:MAG: Rrf2 family transcriptional regulator [Eubacteriales bacterium]|nr:Rrf2 family transcriptional regulator [Eubacteriales bacterium]
MQISSRFTIAIHVLVCMETFKEEYKVTSEFLASSVSVNPVVVRKVLGQLKKAGIVTNTRGSRGAKLARPLGEITLFDIYQAVECLESGELFHFHENPNPQCPVGRNIHSVLDGRLWRVQRAMEQELSHITMEDIFLETREKLEAEKGESGEEKNF